MSKSAPKKFEDALTRLEEIVRNLESGDLTLEESLENFEEGMKLTKLCNDRLDSAQKKIETLLKDHQGNLAKKPFNPDAAED